MFLVLVLFGEGVLCVGVDEGGGERGAGEGKKKWVVEVVVEAAELIMAKLKNLGLPKETSSFELILTLASTHRSRAQRISKYPFPKTPAISFPASLSKQESIFRTLRERV